MIYGIGTDIIEVKRIREAIEKYGDRFLNRIYTKIEQDYCEAFKSKKYLHYAARFAAKESFSKAIGTGLSQGFSFTEVGIINEKSGEPRLALTGDMKLKWGELKTIVSLSHTEEYAVAYLIMEKMESE